MSLFEGSIVTSAAALAAFFLYRLWLEMKSESIIAETDLDADRKKKAEYEKQNEKLEQEIKHDQAEYTSARTKFEHDSKS